MLRRIKAAIAAFCNPDLVSDMTPEESAEELARVYSDARRYVGMDVSETLSRTKFWLNELERELGL